MTVLRQRCGQGAGQLCRVADRHRRPTVSGSRVLCGHLGRLHDLPAHPDNIALA
jgi:hypothetical protein